jgi:quercetin dioxygenase-like cupin family protein
MGIVRNNQGQHLQVLGDAVQVLLGSASSPHRMSVMTVEVAPGGQVPPHRHGEEESYYVLSGTLAMTIGSEQHVLTPGDFAHVPPDAVHGYVNPAAEPARFLACAVGGPIDRFFAGMSEHVKAMPDDAPAMMELMTQYGVRMAEPV